MSPRCWILSVWHRKGRRRFSNRYCNPPAIRRLLTCTAPNAVRCKCRHFIPRNDINNMQPILKIDLTTGKTEEYAIPPQWEKDFLGGASLAARILYSFLTRELDPLSPEAPLLFMMGPMTGTSGPTTGRFVVCGKGPATGLWAESNIGGFWGPELRAAGYDGLWITGRAAEPVYLWLDSSRLEVRSAAKLWGQDTYRTQEEVK